MAKLVVEVVDASDLMPKDGNGGSSPFVEVDFDDQRQNTVTKADNLNPYWNEKLVFNLANPSLLSNKTIDFAVFNDGKAGHQRNFLGRVRISGVAVPFSESESPIQRYPLDKRNPFSLVRGDIALKIYAVHHPSSYPPPPLQSVNVHSTETPFQETITNEYEDESKKKKKKKEVKTFFSIGKATADPSPPPPLFTGFEKASQPSMTARVDFAQRGPPAATLMHLRIPMQNPEIGFVVTNPPLATRLRDKRASTYDLVEQMHYLYVSVVKAQNLPSMDVSGSLDPYVELKLGNYKKVTNHLEKNQNPVWKQIFAFSKEKLQSNLLEVTVKDKDIEKDDFVGRVRFNLSEVPFHVPPDSPLAPQWYNLEGKKGGKTKGEIMLAVWMGTQADPSFPEAWHSDAHSLSHGKIYFSPRLHYLRIQVIEAQDLVPSERGRPANTYVKIQLGNQTRVTKPSQMRESNPNWNEEFMFVVSEPFEDNIIVTVEDRIGDGKDEILGRLIVPLKHVPERVETAKFPDTRWFNLHKPSVAADEKKDEFSSKIHLQICVDGGYHVLDEPTHFSSDLQPSSKHLRKSSIGILHLGILSARNLLPMKARDGRTTGAYCVAKYGNKWVRTRTLLDPLAPRWNEKYTFEVHDPCTVITIGVFDNSHINGSREDAKDARIGKVRIRLSTLEINRLYTHYYPLLVLQSPGLKKHGELELTLRFTCTSWVNMVAQYGKPLLPKMHYANPLSVWQIDWLRRQAMQIVTARLSRAEPPIRPEVVEYMLDVDSDLWSLRRSKANIHRMRSLVSGITAVCRWFDSVCSWRNPWTTCLVHVLFFILICNPGMILPTIFLSLFGIGVWNYRFKPRAPPHMEARLSQAEYVHPDELDEEFETFPATRPSDIVRARYDRLRSMAEKVQTEVGDLATQVERAHAILIWRDPRATAMFILFSLALAVFIYVTPFQVVALLAGLYWLRHPRFRSKIPSVPVNFFKRLTSRSDMLL